MEQKRILQTVKATVARAYIIWKINRRAKLLRYKESFGASIHSDHQLIVRYRLVTSSCILDLGLTLLRYADRLASLSPPSSL